jgi:hypothetical protein
MKHGFIFTVIKKGEEEEKENITFYNALQL